MPAVDPVTRAVFPASLRSMGVLRESSVLWIHHGIGKTLASEVEAEAVAQFSAAVRGDGEGAAVEFAGEPFFLQGDSEERGAEAAANVGAALRPIETTESEATALGAGGFNVEAEGGERACALGGKDVGAIAADVGGAGRLEPACGDEAVVERDGEGAGDVVVATAGGAEMDGSGGGEAAARAAGEDAEALERASDGGRGERVVAVT